MQVGNVLIVVPPHCISYSCITLACITDFRKVRGKFRACLHEGGGPRVGEVTCGKLPHLTCKRDDIKMRDYMDRQVTPPKRVTSPTWGPPPPCEQALRDAIAGRRKGKSLITHQ